jgi:hypothetical protein
MNFDYTKIPTEKAYALRKQFIDAFVDTSHELYVKYIRDVQASDIVQGEGLVLSHLWSCLHKSTAHVVDFYAAMRYLYRLKNETVYVMWDIRPEKIVYPKSWSDYPSYTPPCEILLKSDEMISIDAKELCEVLLHDHHIAEDRIVDMSRYFLREDVYIFDATCTWYIALTHEEHNQKRLCFSNVGEIKSLEVV